MDRLEQYCAEHDWTIFTTQGWLCVEKKSGKYSGDQLSYKLETVMDIDNIINEMRLVDGLPVPGETQQLFPFASS